MTTPTTSPGPLYYLLSLYAALDEAVITSADEGIAETVEQFLPGTTGDNAGWSLSLTELVGPMAPLPEALRDIAAGPQLSIPELSRLVFIVGALTHIPDYLRANDSGFADVLALAGPEGAQNTERGAQLRDWLQHEFNGWQDWDKLKGDPVEQHLLDARVPQVPLCNAYLSEHDGVECVVIDTLFDDTELTPQKVKDVLDLKNWDDVAGRYLRRDDRAPTGPHGRMVSSAGDYGHHRRGSVFLQAANQPEVHQDRSGPIRRSAAVRTRRLQVLPRRRRRQGDRGPRLPQRQGAQPRSRQAGSAGRDEESGPHRGLPARAAEDLDLRTGLWARLHGDDLRRRAGSLSGLDEVGRSPATCGTRATPAPARMPLDPAAQGQDEARPPFRPKTAGALAVTMVADCLAGTSPRTARKSRRSGPSDSSRSPIWLSSAASWAPGWPATYGSSSTSSSKLPPPNTRPGQRNRGAVTHE